jgi:hypothetical protein
MNRCILLLLIPLLFLLLREQPISSRAPTLVNVPNTFPSTLDSVPVLSPSSIGGFGGNPLNLDVELGSCATFPNFPTFPGLERLVRTLTESQNGLFQSVRRLFRDDCENRYLGYTIQEAQSMAARTSNLYNDIQATRNQIKDLRGNFYTGENIQCFDELDQEAQRNLTNLTALYNRMQGYISNPNSIPMAGAYTTGCSIQ